MKSPRLCLAIALLLPSLGLSGCQSFWRKIDANVVSLHQDKLSYVREFREDEAKQRALVEASEAASSPPAVQLRAIGSYVRSAQAYREALARSLRFVREHEKEIARCGLSGLVAEDLSKASAEQKQLFDAMMARAKQLQAVVAQEEAAASGTKRQP